MKVETKHREQHRATKNIIHKIARRKKKVVSNFLKLICILYFTIAQKKIASNMLLHENRA